MYNNAQIINHLKKDICNIRVYTRKSFEGYKRKELEFRYSTKGSWLEKENRHNAFWYTASEEKVDELAQKDPMELLEFLATKHLEKNVGYGKEPKQFQTPCYLCNQRTLTTLGWSEAGYPDNLERFFCRLCWTSFDWIDIKDDPLELQREMRSYYIVFKEEEIKKDNQLLREISKKLEEVTKRLENNCEFVRIEQRTPI